MAASTGFDENGHLGGGGEAWLIYDGDCPFCSSYAKHQRMREHFGVLHLVDARKGGPMVDEARSARFDLDHGMVLKIADRFYHGAECLQVLSMVGSRSTLFGRASAAIFKSPFLCRLLYPLLRLGRCMTLRMLRRGPISRGGPRP